MNNLNANYYHFESFRNIIWSDKKLNAIDNITPADVIYERLRYIFSEFYWLKRSLTFQDQTPAIPVIIIKTLDFAL